MKYLQSLLKISVDMQQDDANWREEALALLDGLGRALYQTTRRLFSASELDITEVDVPRLIKAVLEQARAFVDELKIAPADEVYNWLAQTEDLVDRLSDQRETMRVLPETWLAWASDSPLKQSDQHLLQVYEKTRAFLEQPKE